MQSTQASNWQKFHINYNGERSCNGECQRGVLQLGNSLSTVVLSDLWDDSLCSMSWLNWEPPLSKLPVESVHCVKSSCYENRIKHDILCIYIYIWYSHRYRANGFYSDDMVLLYTRSIWLSFSLPGIDTQLPRSILAAAWSFWGWLRFECRK